jgi:hypothetical protein
MGHTSQIEPANCLRTYYSIKAADEIVFPLETANTMESAQNSLPTDRRPEKTAVIVVRGVGEAIADETVALLEGALAEYGIDRTLAREVNWSWTEAVEWPFAKASGPRTQTKTSIPRTEFLRNLGFSGGKSGGNSPHLLGNIQKGKSKKK